METQEELNYDRIAKAIHYLQTEFKNQPVLNEVAEHVHLSPYHFQRIFKKWAGVSPKKFLQYLSVDYAKQLLADNHMSLFDAADETGLSGTSRLHDLFITIEGMTPGTFKNGGKNLEIHYDIKQTPFGKCFIANTDKGICSMSFLSDQTNPMESLRNQFPNASIKQKTSSLQQSAMAIFSNKDFNKISIPLHLKGTDFQIKVWESLLRIPKGKLTTYGRIASNINNPNAFRAVGTAIGKNPIAYLIPCHRVIQASGNLGQYHWGSTRKAAITGWEAASIQD